MNLSFRSVLLLNFSLLIILGLTKGTFGFVNLGGKEIGVAHGRSLQGSKRTTRYHTFRTKSKTELNGHNDDLNDCQGFNFNRINNLVTKHGDLIKSWVGATVLGVSLATGIVAPQPVLATDTIAVGKCVLQNCQKELALCVLNPKCLANVICLNTCNNRPDETECQIKCGDLFDNEQTAEFNCCAVTQKKCVPQRADTGEYPVPPEDAVVKKFDTKLFDGRWYITAGLNELFDTFDCQVHFFDTPMKGNLYAKINWRITEPDGEFFTKNVLQTFIQDEQNPGILYNHDNEFLNYQDDWYILDYEPENFIFVYYRGTNDAWDGYGGAVVYTRESTLNPEYVPRLEAAASSVGRRWSEFKLTDNTCKEPEDPLVLRSEYAKKVLLLEEQALQEQLTAARLSTLKVIEGAEKEAEEAIKRLEEQVFQYEAQLFSGAGEIEKEIVKEVKEVENQLFKGLFKR
mmetsp:Transcript_149/g.184  ORF Transcript_149/g.184 Transcript_149/m.184 type:complete len:458 (+) Transcript_149:131-1504(+)